MRIIGSFSNTAVQRPVSEPVKYSGAFERVPQTVPI
jgi:hypothetical protein